MRKLCTICAVIAYILVLQHSIASTICVLTHTPSHWPLPIKLLFLCALCIHIVTSIILLIKGHADKKGLPAKSKVSSHTKLNRSIWVRRITGFAVLALALFHVFVNLAHIPSLTFTTAQGGSLIVLIVLFLLLLIVLAIHLINSVESLFIGLGVKPAHAVVALIRVILLLLFLTIFCLMLYCCGGLL